MDSQEVAREDGCGLSRGDLTLKGSYGAQHPPPVSTTNVPLNLTDLVTILHGFMPIRMALETDPEMGPKVLDLTDCLVRRIQETNKKNMGI